jgi:hypothetical protein
MKKLFFGTGKNLIIESAEDLEVSMREYPLARILCVRRRTRWACLRRWAAFWEVWTPSAHLHKLCDLWTKAAVIAAALYFAVEIGAAFLPGGAVERVLGGGR